MSHLPTHSTNPHKLDVRSFDVNEEDDLGLANDVNASASSVPSLWGIPLKYISCAV